MPRGQRKSANNLNSKSETNLKFKWHSYFSADVFATCIFAFFDNLLPVGLKLSVKLLTYERKRNEIGIKYCIPVYRLHLNKDWKTLEV